MPEELFGNTEGLKASHTRRLLATWRRRVHPGEVCSAELARHLTELSRELGRQLGVLLNRRGEVESVIVGDARQIFLPDIGRARAGQLRLRGLRLVHTHLAGEPIDRDDTTDLVLLRLDLVAAIQARTDGLPGSIELALVLPPRATVRAEPVEALHRTVEFDSVQAASEGFDLEGELAALEQEIARTQPVREIGVEGRAILVSVFTTRREAAEASLKELKELCRTAGVVVLDVVMQSRKEVDPRTLIGEGKLSDVLLRSMALGADMLIFDRNLSPSQARHVSEGTSVKILDRTQLILDIFARRAQSADGKLQVELAQLRYLLPRLVGQDDSLSRLAGGIGGRGPGETKLEMDRRRVRDRIAMLEDKIDRLSNDRAVRRRQRNKSGVPVVSIVGYTNAGKSTLLNALTNSSVLAEDKLFATLDPTSRRLRFPREREVVLTDTVGFIRDLPKDLVAAFRATLEELEDADLLLHVVDASDAAHEEQAKAVEAILATLDLEETARLLVFNKADQAERAHALALEKGGTAVSARTRAGFDELLARCEKLLWREGKEISEARATRPAPPPRA